MFFFHPMYFVLVGPAILLAIYAQAKVRSAYNKYSKVTPSRRLTGREVARRLLDDSGVKGISIERIRGQLTDHYDPRSKVLRLSEPIYEGRSFAAIGVAAHEVGHAIQDKGGYFPLRIRHGIFPIANFGSGLAWPMVICGLIFRFPALINLGIIFFSAAVIFHIVTLPVEFNASHRALALLQGRGYLTESEIGPTRKVLNAAALTYLAATAVAVMQLIYLLLLRGNRD